VGVLWPVHNFLERVERYGWRFRVEKYRRLCYRMAFLCGVYTSAGDQYRYFKIGGRWEAFLPPLLQMCLFQPAFKHHYEGTIVLKESTCTLTRLSIL
jgi:hypothetical protein